MSRQAQPPFKLILHSNGSVDVQAASAEMEEAVRRGFQLRTTKDLDGQIVRLDLGVDLAEILSLEMIDD